nr:MAG TPA: hypothetical protein [Caudoviricetes sp.]
MYSLKFVIFVSYLYEYLYSFCRLIFSHTMKIRPKSS